MRTTKTASDIEPTSVKWLWTPYIARRKLTLFDGDPGAGKSMICIDLVARITTGRAFPGHTGGTLHKPRKVLYLTQEDDLDDTVVPRLMAAGANLDLVLLDDGDLDLGADEQKRELWRTVRHERPALVVLDTLAGYVGGGTDLFRENSVRPVLIGLALMAREYETSVIALRHLTKGDKTKAIYLGQGSMAIVGVARSVLLVGADPNDGDRRALFHVKNNLGRTADPLGYGFDDDGALAWRTETDLTIGDVMKPPGDDEPKVTKGEQAETIIIGMLADKSVDAQTMMKVLDSHGIGERTANRAKKRIGVKSAQLEGRWLWSLPHGYVAARELVQRVNGDGGDGSE
jgi:hypothetical protein